MSGRLKYAGVDINQRHPIVLLAKHHVTNLILKHEHVRALHCGPEELNSPMTTKFWPIAGRQAAKRVIRNCHNCFPYKPKGAEHIMGNLPSSRVVDTIDHLPLMISTMLAHSNSKAQNEEEEHAQQRNI